MCAAARLLQLRRRCWIDESLRQRATHDHGTFRFCHEYPNGKIFRFPRGCWRTLRRNGNHRTDPYSIVCCHTLSVEFTHESDAERSLVYAFFFSHGVHMLWCVWAEFNCSASTEPHFSNRDCHRNGRFRGLTVRRRWYRTLQTARWCPGACSESMPC